MDIYFKKRRWKQILFLIAVFIGIGSITYTNILIKQVSKEEQIKVERWAEATRLLVSFDNLGSDVTNFLNDIILTNTTIPIIVVDQQKNILSDRNIKYNDKNKQRVLESELAKMIAKNNVIEIPVSKNEMQYLYYKESSLLVNLRYYPVFQLGVILIFIVVAYIAFSSARKSEQNLVWIGLAKETAHQLGTPISSLIAWIELLKDEQVDELTLTELSKDVNKLKKISERFSKIGSKPELYPENIYAILTNTVQYLRTRVSKKIVFKTNFSETDELFVPLSASLFGWVIENIIKNSVDSIEDKKGTITLEVQSNEKEIIIDISDTGRGINKSRFKTIFNPGYTTKQRGWGLGLSLSKRIIEIYHRGKIFIKSSESYKQTTFRIILKIKQKNYE